MSTNPRKSANQTDSSSHEEPPPKGEPPVWSRRYRGTGAFLDIAVFQKEMTSDNGSFSVFSIKMVRSYKDGDAWKDTHSLRPEDLPVVSAGLLQAYEFICSEMNRA
jgi:hypothetical protein